LGTNHSWIAGSKFFFCFLDMLKISKSIFSRKILHGIGLETNQIWINWWLVPTLRYFILFMLCLCL
jgi:hypothetical protein